MEVRHRHRHFHLVPRVLQVHARLRLERTDGTRMAHLVHRRPEAHRRAVRLLARRLAILHSHQTEVDATAVRDPNRMVVLNRQAHYPKVLPLQADFDPVEFLSLDCPCRSPLSDGLLPKHRHPTLGHCRRALQPKVESPGWQTPRPVHQLHQC